jgi:hypothetical protein
MCLGSVLSFFDLCHHHHAAYFMEERLGLCSISALPKPHLLAKLPQCSSPLSVNLHRSEGPYSVEKVEAAVVKVVVVVVVVQRGALAREAVVQAVRAQRAPGSRVLSLAVGLPRARLRTDPEVGG